MGVSLSYAFGKLIRKVRFSESASIHDVVRSFSGYGRDCPHPVLGTEEDSSDEVARPVVASVRKGVLVRMVLRL